MIIFCSIAATFALQYLTIKYQTKSTTAQARNMCTLILFYSLQNCASAQVLKYLLSKPEYLLIANLSTALRCFRSPLRCCYYTQ